MLLSVVVLTHEWPQALELALRSLARQHCPWPWEVIVTDDGSGPETLATVQRVAEHFPVPLRYVWQPHEGFRAARARNRGIAAAAGDYVVLLDGDMVPQSAFLQDHVAFAKPQAFLQGGRVLLDEARTRHLIEAGRLDIGPWSLGLDRRSKALRMPLLARWKARPRHDLTTIMSCNQSYWRKDLLAVNGFDEAMVGWGYEDTELAARCLHYGLTRYSLKFCAIAAHLHHASRGNLGSENPGKARFEATLANKVVRCERGIDGHLATFAQRPDDLRPAHRQGA